MIRNMRAAVACLVVLAAPVAAWAQNQVVAPPTSDRVPTSAVAFGAYGAPATPVDAANGLPVECIGGCASPVTFAPEAAASLAVTTTTGAAALGTGDNVLLRNNGSVDLYFLLGASDVEAAATDFLLPAGHSILVAKGSNTHVAAITASGSTSLSVTTGDGAPVISGGGGTGSGGGDATAANQTTIIGHIDQLEGYLDTVETKLDASNTHLAAIQTAAEDTTPTAVVGGTAADSAASDAPLLGGCRASNAAPTAVANGDVVYERCDLYGNKVTWAYAPRELLVSGLTAAMTGTTSTAVTGIGAPGAGLYNYITTLACGNSHATVGTFVEVQDGSGGTTFFTVPAAAVYGGAVLSFPVPLKQPTANTALYVKNTTTGANVICSVAGFKAP
ncbi:MAG: hypothetical protein ACOY5Y_06965 [Pseudomonadota bacterium]